MPKKYWIFSNKPEGFYENNHWDMTTILNKQLYSIKESENNRKYVEPEDLVYLRIYGQGFVGKFTIAGPWKPAPKNQQKYGVVMGYFPMKDLVLWNCALPQNLVYGMLSNQNYRKRIVSISTEDASMFEIAKNVYGKLGFAKADGEIIILEKGIEEAIKPNLQKLGLKLASEKIRQQFVMGPGAGRSDLICTDFKGDLVVIELKKGQTSDATVGQVLRYVGWLQENIAKPNQKVHGWIVAGDFDEGLRLAAIAAKIKLVLVKLG